MTTFLELKNAFDTVDHRILIDKLIKYSIKGKEIESLNSYLSGRKPFRTINAHRSRIEKVICSIPQGSYSGTLLFIICLNDFESCLEFSKAKMYADDTHATMATNDLTELISMTKKELLNISDWWRVNILSPNPRKQNLWLLVTNVE